MLQMKFYEILFSMSRASCLGPFLRLSLLYSVFRSIQILYFNKNIYEYESTEENIIKVFKLKVLRKMSPFIYYYIIRLFLLIH